MVVLSTGFADFYQNLEKSGLLMNVIIGQQVKNYRLLLRIKSEEITI